jgi:hypothetical protein
VTLEQLIASARVQVMDTGTPPAVSDDAFAEFANEAEEEACRRARLMLDSSTEAVCHAAAAAGTDLVDLDGRIIFVRRVVVVGQARPLQKIPLADLDQQGTEWMEEEGEVMGWVPDFESGKIRLYRKPDTDIELRLTVVRLPLEAMAADADTPEIKQQMHRHLVHWMRHRFYSLPDAELNNPRAAAEALAAFEAQFGPPSTAQDEQWIHEKHGFDEYEGLR